MTLRVIGARAVQEATRPLAARFTAQTGEAVEHSYSPVGTVRKRLADGEHHDIVIISESAIGALAKDGTIDGATATPLGSTSVGMCVRKGAPRLDISTPGKFRAVLENARAVALSDPSVGGTAGTHMHKLIAELGLTDAINAKAQLRGGGVDVANAVANGEAEIGFTFISEILPVPGAEVAGKLPAPHGNTTAYVAAVHRNCANPDAARALIAAFVAPGTEALWREIGFDPA